AAIYSPRIPGLAIRAVFVSEVPRRLLGVSFSQRTASLGIFLGLAARDEEPAFCLEWPALRVVLRVLSSGAGADAGPGFDHSLAVAFRSPNPAAAESRHHSRVFGWYRTV